MVPVQVGYAEQPKNSPVSLSHPHGLTTLWTRWRVIGAAMLLFLLGFDTYFGHVLMKTAFIAEVFAVPLQKAVQHMYCPVDDNQQGIGGGNTVARIEPWREFGFLREDVRAGIVVEVIAKGCRIEAQSENGGRCRGRMWPWHLVVIKSRVM